MRNELAHRPAWLLAIGLALGIASDTGLPYLLVLAPFVFPQWRHWLLIVGAFLVGCWLRPASPDLVTKREAFQGVATVEGVPRMYADGYAVSVRANGKAYRMSWKDAELAFGDRVLVRGRLAPLREGAEHARRAEGLSGRILADEVRPLSQSGGLSAAGMAWRRQFVDTMGRSLDPFEANVAMALCFNVDAGLPDDLREDLRRTGTIHLISASGMHVLIYAATGLFLASLLPVRRSIQVLAVILLLITYAAAAGFQPPIVRSVGMAAILLCAFLFRRQPDLFNSLGVVLGAYLLVMPRALFDVGFQLSFVTVAGLALWARWEGPQAPGIGPWLRSSLRDTARGSLVALLASAPLVAYHFGQVSVISVVANVVVAGLVGPILVLCMGAGLCAGPTAGIGDWAARHLAQPLIDALVLAVQQLACIPFAAVAVPEFSAWWLAVYYGAWLLIWRPREIPA